VINTYPRQPGLVYRLHTSWGTLSGPRGGRTTVTEILNFTLTAEERVNYPCHGIKRVAWLDVCYDSAGAIVPNPTLTVGADSISIPEAVYGSVEVTYDTEKYSHLLYVPRREGAIEEFFSAAVYALYQGGISWLEIDVPVALEALPAPPGLTTTQDLLAMSLTGVEQLWITVLKKL
jgi:hypothetical protein